MGVAIHHQLPEQVTFDRCDGIPIPKNLIWLFWERIQFLAAFCEKRPGNQIISGNEFGIAIGRDRTVLSLEHDGHISTPLNIVMETF